MLILDKFNAKIVRLAIEEHIPFNKYLGIKVEELGVGFAILKMPFSPHLIGNPLLPALHGGAIATLMDTTGGAAAMTTLVTLEDRLATIDMRVDYLLPAKPKDLYVESKVIRSGRRIIVTSMSAYHEKGGDIVADGRAVYNAIRQKPKTETPA